MYGARFRAKEKYIKKQLVEELLKLKRNKLEEIVEWLWEEFGIKTKPNMEAIRKAIVENDEVTSRELAIEVLRSGGYVNEELWFTPDEGNMRDNK
ncbi:MAG: hypothetical protein ACP5RO_07190 [Fervidicoccaceae archaeon]